MMKCNKQEDKLTTYFVPFKDFFACVKNVFHTSLFIVTLRICPV